MEMCRHILRSGNKDDLCLGLRFLENGVILKQN